MLETLLKVVGYTTNAYTFIVTNIKAILIASAVIVVMYFVIGFFNLRNQLLATKRELEAAKAQVEQLQKDVTAISHARDDLSKKTQELEKDRRELTEKLIGHDIGKLAKRHSRLIEKAVNGGTDKALRCIEAISRGEDC